MCQFPSFYTTSVLYVCTKFRADRSFRSKSGGTQHFEIGSRDPGNVHLRAVYATYAGGSVLHLRTIFEADCSIWSIVINGSQNLEIRSCDPGHAHLGIIL